MFTVELLWNHVQSLNPSQKFHSIEQYDRQRFWQMSVVYNLVRSIRANATIGSLCLEITSSGLNPVSLTIHTMVLEMLSRNLQIQEISKFKIKGWCLFLYCFCDFTETKKDLPIHSGKYFGALGGFLMTFFGFIVVLWLLTGIIIYVRSKRASSW